MICPNCKKAALESSGDANMIVTLCPECGYSSCYISESESERVFNKVFNSMFREKTVKEEY